MLGSKTDRFCRFAEKPDELRRKNIGDDSDDRSHCTAAGHTEGNPLFYSAMMPCAQVLTDEGGESLSKAGNRQEGKALQLRVGAATRHSRLAEAVDVGLHKDVGKSDYAVLNPRGQTVTDDLHKAVHVKVDLADADPIGCIDSHHMQKAEQRADTLSDGGGNGGRAYAVAEHGHEEHIEGDVDKGGEYEVIKRMLAVADCVQYADENIVHNRKHSAKKVVSEVDDRLGHNLGRCPHPTQDGRGQRNAQNGQRNAGAKSEGDGGMYGLAQGVVLLGTK